MKKKNSNDIGYVWLCSITMKLRRQSVITADQERTINRMNAQKLGVDIIVGL